ncbi:transposase [Lysinibacillus sp. NPDC097287]|uniref:IS66 family transposase n=1 Tax=Lysinibacillus sp. NPDC097287 TaxID=3364144 RepID=UPI0037F214C3
MSPGERRKQRKKHSKPIVEKFLDWVEKSPFYGKNALAKAVEYTLNQVNGQQAFLKDERIEIDNNPAEMLLVMRTQRCAFFIIWAYRTRNLILYAYSVNI